MDRLTVIALQPSVSQVTAFRDMLTRLRKRVEIISREQFLERASAGTTREQASTCLFLLDCATLRNDRIRQALVTHQSRHPQAVNVCLVESLPESECEQQLFAIFHDFLVWPCSAAELSARLKRFRVESSQMADAPLGQELQDSFNRLHLVGRSPCFQKVLKLIVRMSQCDAPVLIRGETGTGKENAARAIHSLGDRTGEDFVPVNCGGLPDELLESELFGHEKGAFTDARQSRPGLVSVANGGTLFLDEVDCLSPKAQASLLRFLQTREYRPVGSRQTLSADVRIMAATNADLEELVGKGLFREDLLYRLNVLVLSMPPLRKRVRDIPLIINCLLQKFSVQHGLPMRPISQSAVLWLMHQPWPGNVRELENLLLRQFLLSDQEVISFGQEASAADEPDGVEGGGSTAPDRAVSIGGRVNTTVSFQKAKSDMIRRFEQEYLRHLLMRTEGNVSAAARLAGKERRAMGKLMKKYKMEREDFRDTTLRL